MMRVGGLVAILFVSSTALVSAQTYPTPVGPPLPAPAPSPYPAPAPAPAPTYPTPTPAPAPQPTTPPTPPPGTSYPTPTPAPVPAPAPVPIEEPPPPAPVVAPAPAPAPAPATATTSVETKHEVDTPSTRKPIQVSAEIVLALPEDGIATLVRTSPGLRVHGYYPLRERVGLAASVDYVRGMNQVDVPGMTAADAFGLAAGARLVLSASDTHSLYAEGMLGLRHLSVDAPAPADYSGTGFGLTFGFGADIAIEGKWRATAAVSYTSCGIDVTNMDGVGTTLGVDFLVLGMGAGTTF